MENSTNLSQLEWEVPEYESHPKTKNWYIMATIIILSIITYFIIKKDLMPIIVVVTIVFVLILKEHNDIDTVLVKLTSEGLFLGQKFYDYDEFKTFLVLYKPQQNIKNLYFRFNSGVRQRLSISLGNMDPGQVRKFLLKYIEENLDRVEIPVSEKINKILKL